MIPRATLVASTVARIKLQDGDFHTLDADDFVAYAARVSNPSNQLSE